MIQVLYEYAQPWPATGSIRLEPQPPMVLDIPVSPDSARRRVNSYLVTYVSMTLYAADPILVIQERKPFWRVSMNMRLPDIGFISTFGHIDVDAQTLDVVPLTKEQIRQFQDRANAFINLIAPKAT